MHQYTRDELTAQMENQGFILAVEDADKQGYFNSKNAKRTIIVYENERAIIFGEGLPVKVNLLPDFPEESPVLE